MRLFAIADTSYAACCADEVTAAHCGARCLVHFGYACFSKTVRIPVFCVTASPLQPADSNDDDGTAFAARCIVQEAGQQPRQGSSLNLTVEVLLGAGIRDLRDKLIGNVLRLGGDGAWCLKEAPPTEHGANGEFTILRRAEVCQTAAEHPHCEVTIRFCAYSPHAIAPLLAAHMNIAAEVLKSIRLRSSSKRLRSAGGKSVVCTSPG